MLNTGLLVNIGAGFEYWQYDWLEKYMRNTFCFQDPSPYIANHAPFWEAIMTQTLCLDNKKNIHMLLAQDC